MSDPRFVVLDHRVDGALTLAKQSSLADDLDAAVEIADEIHGQAYALEPVVLDPPYPPVRAVEVSDVWLGDVPKDAA